MTKIVLARILMFFIIIGVGFLLFASISTYSQEIEMLQEKYIYLRVLIGIVGGMAAFSSFLLWGLMLYHWGNHDFVNLFYKRLWFILMSFGMCVGSWFYYIIVFELNKTLSEGVSKMGRT